MQQNNSSYWKRIQEVSPVSTSRHVKRENLTILSNAMLDAWYFSLTPSLLHCSESTQIQIAPSVCSQHQCLQSVSSHSLHLSPAGTKPRLIAQILEQHDILNLSAAEPGESFVVQHHTHCTQSVIYYYKKNQFAFINR